MPPADNANPLPPSVESAYYRKCIALKRRLNEIEANNEAARLRKMRLDRAILKMRLERAFLLERLAERMAPNVDESDRSTSPPPTPQDKPTRSKRTGRQKTPPPPEGNNGGSMPPHHSPGATSSTAAQPHLHPLHAMSSAQSTPDPARPSTGVMYGASGSSAAGGASNPSAPSPAPAGGLNGTPSSTPFGGSTTQPSTTGAAPVLPLPQPQFVDGSGNAERQHSVENGRPNSGAGADPNRPFAPAASGQGATGEPLTAGPEIQVDANGERRIVEPQEQDTEMGEAGPAQGEGPGGFTAVNR